MTERHDEVAGTRRAARPGTRELRIALLSIPTVLVLGVIALLLSLPEWNAVLAIANIAVSVAILIALVGGIVCLFVGIYKRLG